MKEDKMVSRITPWKYIIFTILTGLFCMGFASCAAKQKDFSLYQAVQSNNEAKAVELIAKGLDPEIKINDEGWRPVIAAVINGNTTILEGLLKAGASPDAKLKNGTAAIHYAAGKKDTAVLETLIKYHPKVNVQNNMGVTPLYVAAKDGNIKAVELLINAGADVSIGKEEGWTPLNVAAYSNLTDMVDLLTKHGAVFTIFDHVALNHMTQVKDLVRTSAEANQMTPHKISLLHFALKNGHMDMARFLISMGADTNLATEEGVLPIHLAALWKDTEMVTYLLEKGADVNARQSNGLTPLHMAAMAGNPDMAEFLLANGAKINAASQAGETPLYSASINNKPETVALLIAKGADTEAEYNGWTPLRVAANRGFKDVVSELIKSPDIRIDDDDQGATALYQACYEGHRDIAELLLNKGANLSKGYKGWSCLHGAARSGSLETVLLLLERGADIHAFIPKTNIGPMEIAYDQHNDKTKDMLMLMTGFYGVVKLVAVRRNVEKGLKSEALLILKDIQGYYDHYANQSKKRIIRLEKKLQTIASRNKIALSLNKTFSEDDNPDTGKEEETPPQQVDPKTVYMINRQKVYLAIFEGHKQKYAGISECIEKQKNAIQCFEVNP